MAAYLAFGATRDASVRTTQPEPGLVVDVAADGRAIGLEIVSPGVVSLAAINRVLAALGQVEATERELATLFAPRGGAAAGAAG